MSAITTTAMHGQSSHVGPLGAAAVLTAVVAAGAVGIAIGRASAATDRRRPIAGPGSTAVDVRPAVRAQKGLGNDQAAIAATKDARASIALPGAAAYGGSDFAVSTTTWAKAQCMAAGSDFPDLYQRS